MVDTVDCKVAGDMVDSKVVGATLSPDTPGEAAALLPPLEGTSEGHMEAPKKVKFDDILVDLGDFGRYQRLAYFLLFLPTIFSAMQKQSWVFLGAKSAHRCRLEGEAANASYLPAGEDLRQALPWDELADRPEQCLMLDTAHAVPCAHGWVFDTSTFGSSAVMDWELVCERKGMRATAQALFMAGVMVGSYLFGWLSDRFGRKPSFFLAVVVQALVGLASGLVHSYWLFVTLRVVVGATTSGVFLVAYVLAMEMVGPRYRVVAGTLCQYYYTAGYLAMAAIAYLLNSDWQLLQIALTLPSILFVTYWWVVPESVRWQISNEKYAEAKEQIQKVAKRNKVELDEGKIDAMVATVVAEKEAAKDEAKASILDLFRGRKLCLQTLIICFLWMVNSGTYYGLALSASNLGGNPYYNYLISAGVELPAYAFNLLVLNHPRVGRRLALSGCMLFAGLVLAITIFIPMDQTAWLVGLSMLGKLAITSSYGTVYIFSAELFPTVVRNVGMGTASLAARIGGILCPYINMLSDTWTPLPLIIYGALAFTGGLLALVLPETLGKELPETIRDGQQMEARGEEGEEEEEVKDVKKDKSEAKSS